MYLENENAETQDVNSGVEEVQSSEPSQETQTPAQETQHEVAQAKPAAQEQVPFHEHPRFKELIEEKNRYRDEQAALKQQLAEMQRQFQAAQPPKPAEVDKVYEKLKGIDPEFADYVKGLKDSAGQVSALQTELQSLRQEQFVREAVAKVDSLHAQNNLSPELRALYNESLDGLYANGRIRTQADLEQAYKAVHERYSKVFEGVKRQERESYVTQKAQTTRAPAPSPKAAPVKPSAKLEFSKDPHTAREQAVKAILQQSRAESDL